MNPSVTNTARTQVTLSKALPWARAVLVPASIVLLALFLRTYRFAVIAWNPDSYEQLRATKRLLAGDFPLSQWYPPGIAVFFALPLSVLPQTLGAMQLVIICSSLALVLMSYLGSKMLTGDPLAASLFAALIAISPLFVYFSRVALFDIVGTLCIVCAVFAIPFLRRRAWPAALVYGVLLAVIINIRVTNVALLPALFYFWLNPHSSEGTWSRVKTELRSARVVAALSTMLVLTAVSIFIGGWAGHATSAPIGVHAVVGNLVLYLFAVWGSGFGAVVVVPLAWFGARSLWRSQRTLLFVIGWVTVIWPLAHAPLPFANQRYMLPGLYFALFLAAHGVTEMLRRARSMGRRRRGYYRAFVFAQVLLLATFYGGVDAVTLLGWRDQAASGDEAAFRELRPWLAQLDRRAFVVSTESRGIEGVNSQVEQFDLLDYSLGHGNGSDSVAEVVRLIDQAQREQRPVYYIYSRFEAEHDNLGAGGPGYDAYFVEVERRFATSVTLQTSVPKFRVYRVSPASEGARQ